MAISFSCECGKRVRARDEFAGRRMRCPDCKRTLSIPSESEPEPLDLADPDFVRPEPPAVVHEQLEPASSPAPDLHDALDVDQIFFAEEKSERTPATTVAKRAPAPLPLSARGRRGSPWIDRCLEQHATPWEPDAQTCCSMEPAPRKRSGAWAWCLLLLLAAGGIAAGWHHVPSSAARNAAWEAYTDLDLVPANTVGFASVRLADLWNDVSTKADPRLVQPLERFIHDHTGLPPQQIERITLVLGPGKPFRAPRFKPVPLSGRNKEKMEKFRAQYLKMVETIAWSGNYLVFIRTSQPFDPTVVARSLRARNEGYPHQTFHVFPTANWINSNGSVLFLNSRTVVLGRENDLKRVIDAEPQPPALLKAALEQAKDKQVVLDMPRPMSQDPPLVLIHLQTKLAQIRQELPVAELKSAALVIHDGKQSPLPK